MARPRIYISFSFMCFQSYFVVLRVLTGLPDDPVYRALPPPVYKLCRCGSNELIRKTFSTSLKSFVSSANNAVLIVSTPEFNYWGYILGFAGLLLSLVGWDVCGKLPRSFRFIDMLSL